ncbi:MAG: hypothetical protein GY711_11235 [bacterium]|nr:hypothetical protein [bacterium]
MIKRTKYALSVATASTLLAPSLAQITNQDLCANAASNVVGPGTYSYDSSAATTGAFGQGEPICEPFLGGGGAEIEQDIWFVYGATSTGRAVVSTCPIGGHDSKLAAYHGTSCPQDGTALACNDDACGLQSSIEFAVVDGQSYLIQLGSFPGAQAGSGLVEIVEQSPISCYSDCDAFLQAAGPVRDAEDFSTFTADTSFASGPVSIAVGAIEALNGAGSRNLVETPSFPSTDHNGTSHASCFVDAGTPTEICITLNQPAQSFGCDVWVTTRTQQVEAVFLSGGNVLAVCPIAENPFGRFVGYIAPTGTIDEIRLRGTFMGPTGQEFGADNLIACVPLTVSMPVPGCPPMPNSSGNTAGISLVWTGLAGAPIEADVAGGPPGQFGYFITGDNAGTPIMPPGSAGLICIGTPLYRYNGPSQVFQLNPMGATASPVALPSNGSFPPVPSVPPGGTRFFQAWYRDGATNNFSDLHELPFPANDQPRVMSADPASGARGTVLTVVGSGFAPEPKDNWIFVGGRTASACVDTATRCRLTAQIHASENVGSGPVEVLIGSGQGPSLHFYAPPNFDSVSSEIFTFVGDDTGVGDAFTYTTPTPNTLDGTWSNGYLAFDIAQFGPWGTITTGLNIDLQIHVGGEWYNACFVFEIGLGNWTLQSCTDHIAHHIDNLGLYSVTVVGSEIRVTKPGADGLSFGTMEAL